MQALEVGDLRLVAGLDERLETGFDERADAAAEDRLLAEEVGFGLLRKSGLDHASPGCADALGIREGDRARLTGRILVHGEQGGRTTALEEDLAHTVPWGFRRHHCHVEIGGRDDGAEADVESVREHEHRTRAEARADGLVDRGLAGIGCQKNHDVGGRGGLNNA